MSDLESSGALPIDSKPGAESLEIEVVQPDRVAQFVREHEREALSTEWNFRIIWHEQRHDLAATRNGVIVGTLGLHIAASLARVERLIVAQSERHRGIGRALLLRAEEIANYYNCHKVTLDAPADVGSARTFFEACGYKVEAILPQHTWKLDVAVMRKFLL